MSNPTIINICFGSDCPIPTIVIEGGKVTIQGREIVSPVSPVIEAGKLIAPPSNISQQKFKKKITHHMNELAKLEAKKVAKKVVTIVKKPKLSSCTVRKLKAYQASSKIEKVLTDLDFIGFKDIEEKDIGDMFN